MDDFRSPEDAAGDRFRTLVEGCPDPIVAVDGTGAIEYASPAIEDVLGYAPAALTGRTLAALLPDGLSGERRRRLEGRLASGSDLADAGRIEFPADADGSVAWLSARFDATDEGAVGVLREDDDGLTARTFRDAVEHAGHAIYVTDVDGTIEYVNPAFTEITGYELEEVVGRNPRVLNSGEMPEEHFGALWETLLSGEVWDETVINRRRSGEIYHAHQTIAPVFENGDVVRFVAIQTDISDRIEVERDRERYEAIVERLEDPIMLQDREGRFRLLNEAVVEFAGCAEDQLLGADESVFMDETTAAAIEEHKRTVVETETPVEYEVSPAFERTDERPTFSTRRYPYYDDGELAGTVAICRDVTELKRREEELRRYERAITGANDLIAATDREGRYLFANPQYRSYHGLGGEVAGRHLADVFSGERYAELEGRLQRVLAGETVTFRTTREHPNRGERILDGHYYPLEDGGTVTGAVAVFRDVTSREETTRQLRVVDRVLRHNLRNELTVIRGIADRLRETEERGVTEAAAEIVDGVDGLLTTSEKSRDITRVLSERPETRPVDVAALVRRVADSAATEHPQARIEVTGPEGAVASATRFIDRAVAELVENAIVHSDRESPTVELAVSADEDGVELAVVDDGPGIPEMDRDVLESGREVGDLYHGSGLGLWMVYWVVHRSGGSIAVDDARPRGSTVTLSLHDDGRPKP